MEEMLQKLLDQGSSLGIHLLLALIVFGIGAKVVHVVVKRVKKTKLLERMDDGVRGFLASFLKIVLYILLVILCCGILGIPATSFVTILASCGVAIGLALQGSLTNFAGGLMLLFFQPFRVGDYIQTGGQEGTVVEIQTFYTLLRTVDNKRVSVPNGAITNAALLNYSAEARRRVDLVFTTAEEYRFADVEAIIRRVLDGIAEIDRSEPLMVHMNCQTPGVLKFEVKVWCAGADYWTVYYAVSEQVHDALLAHNILPPRSYVALRDDAKH